MLVGPFYLVVGVAQGLLRPGFSFARHPLSVLANGDYGWVQTANFALSGLMVIAAAVGVARVVGRGARATSWALAAFGVGVTLAAIFRADPDGWVSGGHAPRAADRHHDDGPAALRWSARSRSPASA